MVEYEILAEGVTPTPTPGIGTPVATTPMKTPGINVTVTVPPVNETAVVAEATTAPPAAATTASGFEAIFAIAGLLAVAFLVLRRSKYPAINCGD